MRSRILVVARDVALRARLARLLKAAGHSVELAESATHANRIGLRGFAVAVVAPDGLGPDANTLMAELDAEGAKALILGMGPDSLDPSDETGLLARIAEATRAPTIADESEPVRCFGRFRLDLAAHVLSDIGGNEVPLTRGEFNLLWEFVQRPGRVLSRDHLLQALAGRDAESFDRSIDMSMVRLRRKIEPDPKRPSLIVTVPGSGYRFATKVTTETATPTETKPEPLVVEPESTQPAVAERRQLTIMHCTLTGPALAAARCDPEDLERLVGAFHERCAAVITQAEGTVDRLLNDGVLAYFGYPQADEHQAERAVRAALKLIETTGQTDTGKLGRAQVRTGVATGLAVVGRQAGVLSEAASIAARLAAAAIADSVLISATTRRLVGELFATHANAPIATEDGRETVEAWQATGESAVDSRFEALRGAALTPLVGREEELELLLRRWGQVKAGSGKVVLISGEPGIGKSRLTRAFQDVIAEQPHTELRFFCSPHHQDSALYPHITQLERAAGFTRDDTDEAKLAKLDAALAQSNASDEAVALIAELLSIPTDQRERIQQMTPRLRREKTLRALLSQLGGLAARKPVLIIYEDIHWIDPSSRELLDWTIEQVGHLPVLLLTTFRPDFQPPWVGESNATSLALTRLDCSGTAALIAEIVGENGLPSDIVQEITDRTDGVPMFIEEVTKAVLESGSQAAEALSFIPHPTLSVPATLHASLIARLDRLGPTARDIAQKGAAIGREFGYELIAAISDRPEPELRDGLERLTGAGLLFARGAPPQSTYQFKHVLVQDTAYDTLVRAARRRVHERIAVFLEQQSPQTARPKQALLAYHFTEAGFAEKAVTCWLKAGQQANAESATAEAVALLRRGQKVLSSLPDGLPRRQQEFELLIALRPALAALKGFASAEVGDAIARAHTLAEQMDRPNDVMPLKGAQWSFHLWRSEHKLAISIAKELEEIGQTRNDSIARLQGCRAHGTARYLLGEFAAARAIIERSLDFADPERSVSAGMADDPRALALAALAYTLVCMGYVDQGQLRLKEALLEVRQLRHTHSMAIALLVANWIDAITRSPELQQHAEELLALSTEHHFPLISGWAIACRGQSLAAFGQAKEGIALLIQGLAAIQTTGAIMKTPMMLTWIAQAHGMIGQPFGGLKCLDEAAQVIQATHERCFEAELHRVRGDLLNVIRDQSGADQSYRQAIVVAQQQSAKLFELRASTSLAQLWRDQGLNADACDLLAPIYGWFTEGFDAPALIEAKALLHELGGMHTAPMSQKSAASAASSGK